MVKTKTDDAAFESNESSLLIDLEAVEEQKFENIPNNKYPCVTEELEYKFSESSGKPMWAVKLTITEGEFEGRKLMTWISFSEAALPMTKTTLNRIAPDLISKTFDPEKIAEEGTMVGKQLIVRTKIEKITQGDRKGEMRTSVKDLYPGGSEADAFANA